MLFYKNYSRKCIKNFGHFFFIFCCAMLCIMEDIKLADLTLSQEELRDKIEILAKKRIIKNYERKSDNKLLRAIKKIIKIAKE